MTSNNSSQPSTNAPSEKTTEEFIQKHMSLIIASVIGVIILGLLIASGIMYLTKKKEKSNRSNVSRARSQHEPPRTHTPARSKTEKSKTKSSPSQTRFSALPSSAVETVRTVVAVEFVQESMEEVLEQQAVVEQVALWMVLDRNQLKYKTIFDYWRY